MNVDQSIAGLPSDVRETLNAAIAENHLSTTDPFVAFFVAHLQLTTFMERRRRMWFIVLAFLGMISTGILGVYYGRSSAPFPGTALSSLPKSTALDGKGILIVDLKSWKPYAWVNSENTKAYLFP